MNEINISLFFVIETFRSTCNCCPDTVNTKSGPFITIEQAKHNLNLIKGSVESDSLSIYEYELDPSKLCHHHTHDINS